MLLCEKGLGLIGRSRRRTTVYQRAKNKINQWFSSAGRAICVRSEAPQSLVRMRSPVRIWVAAPSSSQALYRLRRFFMLCIKNHLALTPLRLLPTLNPPAAGLQGGFCLKFGAAQITRFPVQGRHESFFGGWKHDRTGGLIRYFDKKRSPERDGKPLAFLVPLGKSG